MRHEDGQPITPVGPLRIGISILVCALADNASPGSGHLDVMMAKRFGA
jgi:hypothetical protein